jgi:hypothetical protein
MTLTFYLCDESELLAALSTDATPQTVITEIRRHGSRWMSAEASLTQLERAFEILDEFARSGDFLRQIAFAGSPNYMLSSQPGDWRLGYFEASLAASLNGAYHLQSQKLEEVIDQELDGVQSVVNAFLATLEQAAFEDRSVAMLHG